MTSIVEGGVLIQCYPDDHLPIHVHCFVGDAEIIIELCADRSVTLASRADAMTRNAKKSDLKKALLACANRFDDLLEEWEKMHG